MPDPMCQAIPVAARHAWGTKRTCASKANSTLICDLVERRVCRIHLAAYEKARDESRAYVLAEAWGWLDA